MTLPRLHIQLMKRDRWIATRQDDRKRKMMTVTLSDEARDALKGAAEDKETTVSALIEKWALGLLRRKKA